MHGILGACVSCGFLVVLLPSCKLCVVVVVVVWPERGHMGFGFEMERCVRGYGFFPGWPAVSSRGWFGLVQAAAAGRASACVWAADSYEQSCSLLLMVVGGMAVSGPVIKGGCLQG